MAQSLRDILLPSTGHSCLGKSWQRLVILGLSLTLCFWFSIIFPVFASGLPASASQPRAEELFTIQCAGCHRNGKNVIRRGKNLKLRALQRNGVDSVEAIATLVTNGKGIMSAYGDRLSPDDIDLLAHYVWGQAQKDWQ